MSISYCRRQTWMVEKNLSGPTSCHHYSHSDLTIKQLTTTGADLGGGCRGFKVKPFLCNHQKNAIQEQLNSPEDVGYSYHVL